MFYGQEQIQRELEYILPEVKEGKKINLLLRGRSGQGKTTLAFLICNFLGLENVHFYIPNISGDIGGINTEKRIHFIDEIHMLNSFEFLYPYLDSENFTFILASNESGTLPEPLKNRCINFIFSEYSEEEMNNIVRGFIHEKLPEEYINEIRSRSKNNPRTAKVLCTRLGFIFRNYKVPESLDELKDIMENILKIKAKGLTEQDEVYLNYLSRVGRSSLNNLISGTGIDRSTIMYEIEPFLLYIGLIKIGSRGRELNGYSS